MACVVTSKVVELPNQSQQNIFTGQTGHPVLWVSECRRVECCKQAATSCIVMILGWKPSLKIHVIVMRGIITLI